jgi:hypothetical protein
VSGAASPGCTSNGETNVAVGPNALTLALLNLRVNGSGVLLLAHRGYFSQSIMLIKCIRCGQKQLFRKGSLGGSVSSYNKMQQARTKTEFGGNHFLTELSNVNRKDGCSSGANDHTLFQILRIADLAY